MWKSQGHRNVLTRARLLIILSVAFLSCVLCGFMKPLILGPQMLPPQVMVDLRQVLQSSQWKAGTDNTIRDEDIRGIWMSDVGSRERSTGNIQNNLVNVIQDVVKYADLDHAKEQYSW